MLQVFFVCDIILQVICDGSLPNHFALGENIFNFLINIFTTLSVLLPLLGVLPEIVAPFRSLAIFRILRGTKVLKALKPIWLMLVKATGSLVSVTNLVLFNITVTLVYYMVGRFLYQDTLNGDSRFNFSGVGRGYMTLIVVLTGDGWSSIMYQAMSTFCKGTALDSECDGVYVALSAVYWITYWFYGQFLFITMFLAIILEAFAVEEFMQTAVREDDDKQLTREEVQELIAKFQQLPVTHVSPKLISLAFKKLCVPGKSTVSRNSTMTLVRMVQPMTRWRIAKMTGLVYMRQVMRTTVCLPLVIASDRIATLLEPYPGDEDYIHYDEDDVKLMAKADAEATVAREMAAQMADFMYKLATGGLLGEVLAVATRKGFLAKLDLKDLRQTDPCLQLIILREPDIAKRLGIEGMFDACVDDVMSGSKPSIKTREMLEEDRAMELDEKSGGEVMGFSEVVKTDFLIVKLHKHFRNMCFYLVRSPVFDMVAFGTILTSSVFLCLEPPHRSMASILRYETLRLWDMVFNFIFLTEAVAKMGAFGIYTPRSVDFVAYLQVPQNQLDLFVLTLALIEMSGGTFVTKYIGAGTMKMIRLMKVLRPVRLLMRSEGLKTIIEALVACRKPILYATLFLLVVCMVFAVLAMSLFRKKFWFCSDSSLNGLSGQGKGDCFGVLMHAKVHFLYPRIWENPTGNFDSFGTASLTLMRVLTLYYLPYWFSAQDAYEIDKQPVTGYSMVQASAFFHLFLLVGSFFGLNLFASFMCDTFYSLQGTEQLEEVQWLSIR